MGERGERQMERGKGKNVFFDFFITDKRLSRTTFTRDTQRKNSLLEIHRERIPLVTQKQADKKSIVPLPLQAPDGSRG